MGKTGRLLLGIFFCLLACVEKAEANTANSCLQKNPFIKSLAAPGLTHVEIFAQPKTGRFMYCSSEWRPHGSCCNSEDLVIASNFDDFVIRKNKEVIFYKVYHIENILKMALDYSLSTHWLGENKKFVREVIAIINLESFRKHTDRCWNHMSKIRNSALCSTCSGRSELFFSKDKILISADACRDIVDSCQPYFAHLEQIYSLIKSKRTPFEKMVLELNPYSTIKSSIDLFFQISPPAQLWEAFAEYVKHRGDEQRAGLHSAKVCSMIANIKKLPSLLALEEKDTDFLKYLCKHKARKRFEQSMKEIEKNYVTALDDEAQSFKQKVVQAQAEYSKNVDAVYKEPGKTQAEKAAISRGHHAALEAALLKVNNEKKANYERITKNRDAEQAKTKLAYEESLKASEKITIKSPSNWQQSAFSEGGNRELLKKFDFEIDLKALSFTFQSDSFVFLRKPAIDMPSDFIAPGVLWDDGSGRHATANLSLVFP